MNFIKTSLNICIFLCLWANTNLIQAQEISQIQLLDETTFLPINQATYQYGEQRGHSDEEGIIHFIYTADEVMQLSHVNYGEWELSNNQVFAAINSGVSYKENRMINLYPVTVIAVKPQQGAAEKMDLDYQDNLSHDGGDILNREVSIGGIRKSGSYGFDPVFRGYKYDQLNIVYNGAQSATAACPNRMDPPTSQMAPNMLEKVEILKGPHGLRYGTGFGATINFVPSKLRFNDKPQVYGRLSGGYDTNGDIFRSEGMLGHSGKLHDFSLFAAWAEGDDYETGDEVKIKSNFQRSSFGANLGLKITDHQQLRLSATKNIARDVDFPALPMDLRTDDTWMFNARHDIILNKGKMESWNTSAFASFVDHRMDNLLKPLDPRMMDAATTAKTYNYGGRTEGIWNDKNGTLYAGLDLRIEGADGIRTRSFLMGPMEGMTLEDNAWQDGSISKTGVFAEYHKLVNQFHFVLSGRLEYNHSELSEPSDEFTQIYKETEETQINPNASIGVIRNFEKDIALGLWVGRAQRSGSLTERFINYFPVGLDPYEILGNPMLKPEVNNQVDLTFEWKNEKTNLNIDIFAGYLQDYISSVIDTTLSARLPNSPGVRKTTNIDQAFKTGFEVSWGQQLPAGLQHQAAVAYTYAQDLDLDEPLPEIAPLELRYTLRGSYFDNKIKPEVSARYVAEQSRISTEFGESTTPSFALVDMKITYTWREMLNFSTGVKNLLNENYYEHLNRSVRGTMATPIYAPGRNVFVNFSVVF